MKMLYLFMDYLFLSATVFFSFLTLAAYCAYIFFEVMYEESL